MMINIKTIQLAEAIPVLGGKIFNYPEHWLDNMVEAQRLAKISKINWKVNSAKKVLGAEVM